MNYLYFIIFAILVGMFIYFQVTISAMKNDTTNLSMRLADSEVELSKMTSDLAKVTSDLEQTNTNVQNMSTDISETKLNLAETKSGLDGLYIDNYKAKIYYLMPSSDSYLDQPPWNIIDPKVIDGSLSAFAKYFKLNVDGVTIEQRPEEDITIQGGENGIVYVVGKPVILNNALNYEPNPYEYWYNYVLKPFADREPNYLINELWADNSIVKTIITQNVPPSDKPTQVTQYKYFNGGSIKKRTMASNNYLEWTQWI